MLKKTLLIIIFLLVFAVFSQRGTISKDITGYMGGQVFDNDEATPLENVTIVIKHVEKNITFSDISSKDGTYFLKNLIPGLYTVSLIYLQKEYKYQGQLLAEAKDKFYIKACWALKHEDQTAKLLGRECKTRQPVAWWKQNKVIIIGGTAAAAAAAAIILKEEEEASPNKP
jgi:hypothetical protein